MSLPSDFPWLRFHLPSPLSFHSCIQRKDLPTIYHPSCSQPEVKTANKRKFVTHYLMWKLLLGWGWSHDSLWLKSNTSDSGLLYFRSKTTVFLLCQLNANVVQKYTESIYEIITFAFVLFSVFQSQSRQGFIVYLAHIRTKKRYGCNLDEWYFWDTLWVFHYKTCHPCVICYGLMTNCVILLIFPNLVMLWNKIFVSKNNSILPFREILRHY